MLHKRSVKSKARSYLRLKISDLGLSKFLSVFAYSAPLRFSTLFAVTYEPLTHITRSSSENKIADWTSHPICNLNS